MPLSAITSTSQTARSSRCRSRSAAVVAFDASATARVMSSSASLASSVMAATSFVVSFVAGRCRSGCNASPGLATSIRARCTNRGVICATSATPATSAKKAKGPRGLQRCRFRCTPLQRPATFCRLGGLHRCTCCRRCTVALVALIPATLSFPPLSLVARISPPERISVSCRWGYPVSLAVEVH